MIPSRTWRRPGGSRASLCSQQDKPPAPHPTTAPSRVTLGDKVPGMALGDACATPELALREISAWWDSSTAPSPRHQTLLRVWDRLRWSLRQRCPFTVPRWQRGRWHCHCGVPRGTAGRERDIGHQVTSAVTAQPSTPSRGTCSAPQLSLSPSCPPPVPILSPRKCSPVPGGRHIPVRMDVNSSNVHSCSSSHQVGEAKLPSVQSEQIFPHLSSLASAASLSNPQREGFLPKIQFKFTFLHFKRFLPHPITPCSCPKSLSSSPVAPQGPETPLVCSALLPGGILAQPHPAQRCQQSFEAQPR